MKATSAWKFSSTCFIWPGTAAATRQPLRPTLLKPKLMRYGWRPFIAGITPTEVHRSKACAAALQRPDGQTTHAELQSHAAVEDCRPFQYRLRIRPAQHTFVAPPRQPRCRTDRSWQQRKEALITRRVIGALVESHHRRQLPKKCAYLRPRASTPDAKKLASAVSTPVSFSCG